MSWIVAKTIASRDLVPFRAKLTASPNYLLGLNSTFFSALEDVSQTTDGQALRVGMGHHLLLNNRAWYLKQRQRSGCNA